MTPEQIRQRRTELEIELRTAQKAVGVVRREMRLLEKECEHPMAMKEGNDLISCVDCGKVFSV